MQELQSRLAVWKEIGRTTGTVEATWVCYMILDLGRPGFGLNQEGGRQGQIRQRNTWERI